MYILRDAVAERGRSAGYDTGIKGGERTREDGS